MLHSSIAFPDYLQCGLGESSHSIMAVHIMLSKRAENPGFGIAVKNPPSLFTCHRWDYIESALLGFCPAQTSNLRSPQRRSRGCKTIQQSSTREQMDTDPPAPGQEIPTPPAWVPGWLSDLHTCPWASEAEKSANQAGAS